MSQHYGQDENGRPTIAGAGLDIMAPPPPPRIMIGMLGHRPQSGVLAAIIAAGAGMGVDIGGCMPRRSEKRPAPPSAAQVEIISAAEKKRRKRAAKRLKAMGNR